MDADLLVQQALDCLKRSENEKAAALLKRAVGLAPMRPDIRDLLLVALERRGASSQRQAPAEPSSRIARPDAPPEPGPRSSVRRPAPSESPIPLPASRFGGGRDLRAGEAQAPEADAPISLRGLTPPPQSQSQPVPRRPFRAGGGASSSPIGRGLPAPSSRIPLAVAATIVGLCLLGGGVYFLAPNLSRLALGGGHAPAVTATPTPDPLSERRNDLVKEADTLALAGKYDEASVKLAEALGTSPSDPEREAIQGKIGEFRSQEGTKYLDQRKYTEAAQVFAQAVEADPKNAEWQFWLGRALLLKGSSGESRTIAKEDFLHAKAALEKAVEMDPNLLRAYQSLAQTSIKMNEPPDSAKTYYWQIIQRAPSSPEAVTAIKDLKGMGMQTPPPASPSAPSKTPSPRNP